MLPSVGKIKSMAREVLSKNFFVGIMATLPFVFSLTVLLLVVEVLYTVTNTAIAAIFDIAMICLLVLPLALGTFRFFSRWLEGVCDYPTTVFFYFSNIAVYRKSLNFILRLIIRLLISYFLLSLPAIIVGGLASADVYEFFGFAIPLWTPLLSTISNLLFVLSFIVFIFVNIKYYLSPYLFIIDDETTPANAMKMSMIISRRTQIDFIYLFFGMIVYVVLSLLFLPLIFTMPFLIMTYLVHSKYAVIEYNNTIEALTENKNTTGEIL